VSAVLIELSEEWETGRVYLPSHRLTRRALNAFYRKEVVFPDGGPCIEALSRTWSLRSGCDACPSK